MVTLRLDPAQASVGQVMERLDLAAGEIDLGFGVVAIDHDARLYTILVDEDAARRISGSDCVVGPYANPGIEPFGPSS
jgi:hypothetical protein